MSRIVAVIVALVFAGFAWGAEQLHWVEWADREPPPGTRPATAEDGTPTAVEVTHPGPGGVRVALAVIDSPDITTSRWALEGRVRCRDVHGNGYLEMWSRFPGGGHYFSRTLAEVGPMASLCGSTGWRRFVLPFTSDPTMPPPERLELNLVLPGAGTVALGPVRLIQFDGDEDPLAVAGGWWDSRQGGLIGGLAGGGLGVMGAAIGLLASRGRARRLVMTMLGLMVVVGVAGLGLAAIALVHRQPFVVWYPPGLVGLIATAVGVGVRRSLARHYAEVEDRTIRAMDL